MITHTFSARWVVAAGIAVLPALLTAQTLERRIASAPAGSVGFYFATKANVCGDGISITISDDTTEGWNTRSTRRGIHIGRMSSGYREPCMFGPARVLINRDGASITSVRSSVGGRDSKAQTELGDVSAPEAANYLLAIAPKLDGRSADNAILAAAVADSAVVWKRLLEIARDDDATESARKNSLFWVAQEATAAALVGMDSLVNDDDEDTSVRSDALFHIAQRSKGEGVPILIRVVKTTKSRKLRKDAIWHLSQSADPRALALFEEILAGK